MARAKRDFNSDNGTITLNNSATSRQRRKRKVKPLGLSSTTNSKLLSTVQGLAQEFKDIKLQKQITRTVPNEIINLCSDDESSNHDQTEKQSNNDCETDASFVTIDQTSFYKKETTNTSNKDDDLVQIVSVTNVKKNVKTADDSCIIIEDSQPSTPNKDFISLKQRRPRQLLSTYSPLVGDKPQQALFRVDVTPTTSTPVPNKKGNKKGKIVKRQKQKKKFPFKGAQGKVNVPKNFEHHHRELQLQASNAALENSQNNSFWGPAVKAIEQKKKKLAKAAQKDLVPVSQRQKREIIVDGQNVAYGHGNGKFSPVGIRLCVEYFERREHKVVVFLPNSCKGLDCENILGKLETKRTLVYTPSRLISGHRVQPYDDRYIIDYASTVGGIVVSRDQYRDLLEENPQFTDTIISRLLMYTFVGDYLMFPLDPLGQHGPSLEEFLRFPPAEKPVSENTGGNLETPSCTTTSCADQAPTPTI